MQASQNTVNHLPRQPGRSGTGFVRPSVAGLNDKLGRLTRMTVSIGVHCLSIANEQFKSYESDLGMT